MLRRCLVAFGLSLAAVGCGSSSSSLPDGLESEEGQAKFQQEFVVAHNNIRVRAQPEPSPALTPMVRSLDAANLAQEWANGCVFDHRPNNAMGENIALFSPRPDGESIGADEVVNLWASEAADYDYERNTCAAGAQCGHYTQVVWRNTSSVGCGVAVCDNVDGFGPGTLFVCNYDGPGNVVGEWPY
jgi:pathogenesis-related protein 1